jgi:fused signal recognition particle receptor
MAFFKKLKDRLFKSSSKIDEGLEAIVEDGGAAEDLPAPTDTQMAEPARADRDVPDARPREEAADPRDPVPGDPSPQEEPPVEIPARDLPQEAPVPVDPPASDPAPDEIIPPKAPELPPLETPDRPDDAPDQPKPDEVPQPERPTAPEVPEEIPPSEAPETPAPAPDSPEAPQVPETPARPQALGVEESLSEAPQEAAAKSGFFGRLLGRGSQRTVVRRMLDDDMLEQLEELLITADMGVETSLRVVANMAEGRMGSRLSVEEIKTLLANEVAQIMEPVARPLPLYPKKPQVVLVVGVNGSGKTTTIGKLASQFKAAGKKVVIAAGDTFRAAAVEQLQVWGDRAGVPVLTAPEGSDPASLAFDAMSRAQAEGADLLMIDTAGRLQNRNDLMEELAKIVRVIRKKDPDAPHNTLLVLDATTGQNAVNQVKVFRELADVSGLVMTKLDGTAKGGVLVALADQFGLPIHAIGVGEQIDDLDAFDPEDFARALMGLDAA